jgi:hypothetical protein
MTAAARWREATTAGAIGEFTDPIAFIQQS